MCFILLPYVFDGVSCCVERIGRGGEIVMILFCIFQFFSFSVTVSCCFGILYVRKWDCGWKSYVGSLVMGWIA